MFIRKLFARIFLKVQISVRGFFGRRFNIRRFLLKNFPQFFFFGIIVAISIFQIFDLFGFRSSENSLLKSFAVPASDYGGEEIRLTGQIVSEPEYREKNVKFSLKPDQAHNERVLIFADRFKQLNYGDQVEIRGILKLPENFENEKGIEFDYVNFLAKDSIYTVMYYPEIKLLESNRDQNFISKIFYFKKVFLKNIYEIVPSPEADLAGGILLGTKSSLGAQLETYFRKVGLIHIVVLSGYNVTIIIEAILRFLFFFPMRIKMAIGTICIIAFTIMVGAGATVVRASTMALIAILGRLSHRTYDVNRALYLAGGVMLLINPKILFYDPSFQLSFLATYGLINFGEKMQNWPVFKKLPEKFGIKELTIATISTQIAVLPMLAKMTGEISIIGLPVNLITLPTIPFAMLVSFLTCLFWLTADWFAGFLANHVLGSVFAMGPIVLIMTIAEKIFSIISHFFGIISFFVLTFTIKITEFAATLKIAGTEIATATLPKISWVFVALFYSFIIPAFKKSPVHIFKKVINICTFSAWPIVTHKRVLPHIKRNNRHKSI